MRLANILPLMLAIIPVLSKTIPKKDWTTCLDPTACQEDGSYGGAYYEGSCLCYVSSVSLVL